MAALTLSFQPFVLWGGAGSRLWPLSRAGFPKQFLCLTGKASLFQDAVKRLMDLSDEGIYVRAPLIVTNEEHRSLALEQLREIGVELGAALLEPIARNTAPALTLAALAALAAVENGEAPPFWWSHLQTRRWPTLLHSMEPCTTPLGRRQRRAPS
jgi:mannose-1-phosphate guanylyltransferase/mannose-6-phosphate isomerase